MKDTKEKQIADGNEMSELISFNYITCKYIECDYSIHPSNTCQYPDIGDHAPSRYVRRRCKNEFKKYKNICYNPNKK